MAARSNLADLHGFAGQYPDVPVIGPRANASGHKPLPFDPSRASHVDEELLQSAANAAVRLGRRFTTGGVLITVACLLLAVLAVAMGITSFHAQFSYIFATKHQRLPSMLEALGLDCGAVIFSLLGISLARLGRRAVVERVLVVLCALGSGGMNVLSANLGSPRSVAVWALPPVLFALTSDRLVAVIRRAALGRLADDEAQRSAWQLAGRAVLYVLRFAVAPRSTAAGARQALLNATPLPELPAHAERAVIFGTAADGSTVTVPQHGAIVMGPARAGKPGQSRKGAARPTKTDRLLALAAERHDLTAVPLTEVSSIATGIAGEVDLHAGTARRILLSHVRELQSGSAS